MKKISVESKAKTVALRSKQEQQQSFYVMESFRNPCEHRMSGHTAPSVVLRRALLLKPDTNR